MANEIMVEFHARRRALMVRAAAEAGIYPVVIIVWATIFALVVTGSTSYRIPPLRASLMRDGVMLSAVLMAIAPGGLRYLHRQQHHLRWLTYWGAVRCRLEEGWSLSSALVPGDRSAWHVPRAALAHGIARGTDPEALLVSLGCPPTFAALVAEATSESQLERLLARHLQEATETHIHRLSLRLRLAQPAGILVAGAVVAWVVVRVVRPALELQLERLTV